MDEKTTETKQQPGSDPVTTTLDTQPSEKDTESENTKTAPEVVKVNGENHLDSFFVPQEESYSSESDALVIDESVTKKKSNRTRTKKSKPLELVDNYVKNTCNNSDSVVNSDKPIENGREILDSENLDESPTEGDKNGVTVQDSVTNVNDFLVQGTLSQFCEVTENQSNSNTEIDVFDQPLPHSNPYFNESLFELSQLSQIQSTNSQIVDPEPVVQLRSQPSFSNNQKTIRKIKPKPKGKEYAQYLGLQPAVQFKCSKCGKCGFPSLVSLQNHLIKCKSIAVTTQQNATKSDKEKCSKFKLTRKVFLCSACGTYYENWNLYMHMLNFHKRYVCLYCLGMFSVLDDLFTHIQSRHNVEPGVKNSLEEFQKVYNEPCYVVCCECSKLFTEQDNFFNHKCVPAKSSKTKSKAVKAPIRPEQHVTGEGSLNDIISLEKKSESTDTHKETDKDKSTPTTTAEMTQSTEEQEAIDSEEVNKKQSTSDSEKYTPDDIDNTQCQNDSQDHMSSDMNDKKENEDNNFSTTENVESGQRKDSEEVQNEIREASSEENLDSIDDIQENSPEPMETEEAPPVETRKVPKLSLKIPKPGTYPEAEDSDYSDKMDTNEDQDNIESENENEPIEKSVEEEKNKTPQIPEANHDVPTTELTELEQPLDKMDIRILLQKCLKATAVACIYCNHSRRIPVNGKQLGLHAIAQHRYSAVVKSITAEELHPESFVGRIKESLDELEAMHFNLESGMSEEAVTFSHVYECFQCYYTTNVHKELYLHNRKFHSKSLLLCIMCKSNFYSYSELICHLCPGMYVTEVDLQFRCCMCVSEDLPSSFRLMVHLRKKHNVCDVCLEMCHTQFKLSNHVWKHKLNHFCYRCGIAYRNKPDITRHLFWKHGTESILCKRCLQKKWPHMYHFCQPPPAFTCEECSLTFSKAVYLKVHKRLHSDEKKHHCTFEGCEEKFISKKLMMKHERKHWEPPEDEKPPVEEPKEEVKEEEPKEEEVPPLKEVEQLEEPPKPVKPIVDPINSLPELNLSESDSSDSEHEEDTKPDKPIEESMVKTEPVNKENEKNKTENVESLETKPEQTTFDAEPKTVIPENDKEIDRIWENFKNYQASKDKLFGQDSTEKTESEIADVPSPIVEDEGLTLAIVLMDHDYCALPKEEEVIKDTSLIEVKPALDQADRADHDYCFSKEEEKREENLSYDYSMEEKPKYPEKPPLTLLGGVAASAQEPILEYDDTKLPKGGSGTSSSDSDSSSCSCGSNCSCSSSSGSDSSSDYSSNSDSSTEEGRKKQQLRRQKRAKQKEKARSKNKKKAAAVSPVKQESKVDVVTSDQPAVHVDTPIAESDLETTESDTDEEFYDKQPQIFAKKLLEEKRAMILAQMGPDMLPNGSFFESTSRPPTPPAGTLDEEVILTKKKKKNKKKKKRKSEKNRDSLGNRTYSATLILPEETVVTKAGTPPYYQHRPQGSPTVAPITLSLSRNSPVIAPKTPPLLVTPKDSYSSKPELPNFSRQDSDSSLRASKRRRVPNKFYGYSSDEEEGGGGGVGPSTPKHRKVETSTVSPASPKLVPPITIKTVPLPLAAVPPKRPTVEPITLKLPKPSKSRMKNLHSNNNSSKAHKIKKPIPPIRLPTYLANKIPPRPSFLPPVPPPQLHENDSDSNDSENEQPHQTLHKPSSADYLSAAAEQPRQLQPQLYCYCRCPYDEVSEMIGCDSNDCEIEWFHFECVGIMVPPKGQWYCPDCRKKKQRRELMQSHASYPHV